MTKYSIDAPKVIKGLECCSDTPRIPKCEDCPYVDIKEDGTCYSLQPILSDALKLVHQQRAMIASLQSALDMANLELANNLISKSYSAEDGEACIECMHDFIQKYSASIELTPEDIYNKELNKTCQ